MGSQRVGHDWATFTFIFTIIILYTHWASQVALVKNLPANAENLRDWGSISISERSPGGGHGNPLWYSCPENPMDRGAWQATAIGLHRVGRDFPGGPVAKTSCPQSRRDPGRGVESHMPQSSDPMLKLKIPHVANKIWWSQTNKIKNKQLRASLNERDAWHSFFLLFFKPRTFYLIHKWWLVIEPLS